MRDEVLTLFEAANALITYIDAKNVFDKAAAGGCSGMDYHLSDAFYDLIVDAKKAISVVETGMNTSDTDHQNEMSAKEGCLRLFKALKELATHMEKEHAFDKVDDMGPVGTQTYQSDALVELIQNTHKTLQETEDKLL